jgi:hypothetical protein
VERLWVQRKGPHLRVRDDAARPTRDVPLTGASCTSSNFGTTRLRIPAEGTEDDVTNPPRVVPRHLIDLGIGADNLLRTDKAKLRVRLSVINLTNKEALYNFLST